MLENLPKKGKKTRAALGQSFLSFCVPLPTPSHFHSTLICNGRSDNDDDDDDDDDDDAVTFDR